MGSVFLSHSHEDKEFVRKLAADLGGAEIKVWFDEAEIKIGDSLIHKIEEGIDSFEYVAACLSPNSIRSSWVIKELDIAMNKEIKGRRVVVLPLLLPGCQENEIPLFLSDKRYADFRKPDQYQSTLRELLFRIKLEAVSDPTFDDRYGVIDANRKNRLIEIATRPEVRSQLIDYIVEVIDRRDDPTERYWIYVALGEIGGKKAESAIRKGLSDSNEFARMGADAAWKSMRHSD